jgi:hypothetical protein
MVAERLISVLRMTGTVAHPAGTTSGPADGSSTAGAIENLARMLLATLAVEFLVDGASYPHRRATIGAVVARGGSGDPDEIVARAHGVALQAKSTGDAIAIG